MYLSATRQQSLARVARQYYVLTKPRIVLLAVFCAMIGMFMATTEGESVSWRTLLAGTAGIGLLAAAGFVFNCFVERGIDAVMWRTAHRGSASGDVGNTGMVCFFLALGVTGALLLHLFLSGVGAGDFYMGFKKTAFGKLVLNIAGIGMIVASIVMVGMIIADPSFGPYNAKLPTLDQVRALEGAYRLFHVGCWALGLLVVWALISVIMVAARVGMYRADAKGVPLS